MSPEMNEPSSERKQDATSYGQSRLLRILEMIERLKKDTKHFSASSDLVEDQQVTFSEALATANDFKV